MIANSNAAIPGHVDTSWGRVARPRSQVIAHSQGGSSTEGECVMLTRWDPFMEMQHLQDRLSRLTGTGQGQHGTFSPPVEIAETEGSIITGAELPGVQTKDVNISVENNVL